ncbi:response regulator [Chloroflexota bacterium]
MSNEVIVLIVDDDKATCEALSNVVERKGGYSTDVAGTAREALDIAVHKFFNIILLDLTLPDMDGLELLRRLKELHQSTEVIILSGYTSVNKEAEAVRAEAFAYLVKPSSPKELMGAIERALEKQGELPTEG